MVKSITITSKFCIILKINDCVLVDETASDIAVMMPSHGPAAAVKPPIAAACTPVTAACAAFAAEMAAAVNAEQTVKTLKGQLHDAKGVAVCEKCGAEVAKNAAFCSACGAEMPKPAPVEAEVVTGQAPVEEAPIAEDAPADTIE